MKQPMVSRDSRPARTTLMILTFIRIIPRSYEGKGPWWDCVVCAEERRNKNKEEEEEEVAVFLSHFDHVLAEVVVCAVGWVVTLPAMEMTAQATALLVLVPPLQPRKKPR
ncbi:hypothetical protein PAMP_020038 [Pampus punctatissimus]